MLTKGAIGNLINRYKAVLTKCNLINVFGSLAVASILVMGSAGTALSNDGMEYYTPKTYDFTNYPDITKSPVYGRNFKLLLSTNEGEQQYWTSIEDFFNDEELTKQLERTLFVGYDKNNQKKSNYSININKEITNIIFGGRYGGNLQNLIGEYSDVNSVEIKMNPNAVIYGELNGGGIAAGWRLAETNENGEEIVLRGNKDGVKSRSKVTTTTININGGALYPIGEENNEVKGAGGYTYIRGGGASMNGGQIRVGTATINISGSAGNTGNGKGQASIPYLPYTSIMGGGTNGGRYATIINSDTLATRENLLGEEKIHDGYQKIGWYITENDEKPGTDEVYWYNKTDNAIINIDKMAYRKNILGIDGSYSPKEITWLGSTIFAGGDNSLVRNSTINLTDSSVGTVFSGGECYGVTENTTINLKNSIIFDFYTGAKDDTSEGVGLPHKTQHDGLVGTVTVNMRENSAVCSYSGQIFDNEGATYTATRADGKVISVTWQDSGKLASDLKSWTNPNKTRLNSTLIFTTDGTNNRLYLKDGFTSDAYLASAQAVMDSKVSEGKIEVIRTGKSDRTIGSSGVPSTGDSHRNSPSYVVEDTSFSAGYADVAGANLNIEKNSNDEATTIHLTGIAEVKDYYHNPTDEGTGQVFNTDYATRELLTLKNSSTAIENLAIGNGCTLRLGNETEHTGGTLSGTVSLGDATSNGTIDVVGGRFTLDKVEANAGDTIIVGSANSSAKLILGDETNLNGATVFLDPAWTGIAEQDVIENATHMVRTNGTVDANYIVGQNSVLTLAKGMSDADAEQETYDNFNDLAESGVHWGEDGITAALSLLTPHTIADGTSITVDGSKQHQGASTPAVASSGSSGDAYFAKNSLFMIGEDALGQKDASGNDIPALSGDKLTIADDAKIAMPSAESGKSYTVAKFTNTERQGNQTGWTGDNVLINKVVNGEASLDADGNLVITATESTINSAYLPQNAIDAWRKNHGEGVGSDFFSAALASDVDDTLSVNTVNEVTQASVTAGVQNTALRLADAASENVLHHLSLGNFDSGNSIHADGTDFWATPMYGNTYTSGMSASGASVRGNYGGIAFGADTQVGEVLGGKVRVGAALNGGGGKSETKGTATTTQNDYNFGGINLYAGWNKGNINVIAGLGYGIGDNEVTMALPASMKMGTAKADVDTSVITADLRAEYQLKSNWLDILPHAGVRYTALRTDSHDLKVNGSVLNSVDAETQHIVQFPIGVTLTKNIDAWGWNVKPQVDVSVIPAAGDKDMNTKVRFSGVDAVDSIDTRIMDSTSWSGMVGIQASKGNLSLGLNYGIQASSHETDQRVQASIGWKF